MKVNIDPMPALRAAQIEQVNRNFASMYNENSHRYAAHARKREVATQVLAGGKWSEAFANEAQARSLTPRQFAELVLSKEDELDTLELQRQLSMTKIEAAKTPEELTKLVEG